jgi:Ni/Co efflux regulator RcnB
MLLAAAALSILLPGAALAQGHGRGHQDQQGEARGHGRGHQDEGKGHAARQNVAENRDRRDFQRGRDFRGRDEHGRRNFTYRGRQYAAVRGTEFRYPRGYSYRAWHRGDVLPRLFIAAPYFVDYAYLGLPPTPPGTRWVRYGPDALLIDVYNGSIVDVIYDAFY